MTLWDLFVNNDWVWIADLYYRSIALEREKHGDRELLECRISQIEVGYSVAEVLVFPEAVSPNTEIAMRCQTDEVDCVGGGDKYWNFS